MQRDPLISHEWVGMAEAAQFMGIGEEYLRYLARRGKLPVQNFHRMWFIHRSDLESYIRQRQERIEAARRVSPTRERLRMTRERDLRSLAPSEIDDA